jgi:hypothetical protein
MHSCDVSRISRDAPQLAAVERPSSRPVSHGVRSFPRTAFARLARLTPRPSAKYRFNMGVCSPHLLLHAIVLLTAASTLAAGVPQSSSPGCRKDGERLIVCCEDSGRGEDAVKPRSGEDSEKSEEEEETSREVELFAERAVVIGRGDESFFSVIVMETASGVHRHSPKSSIRGPPSAS